MKSTKTIDSNTGTITYKNEYGSYHREDGPAVIHTTGEEIWYNNGKLHRIDGPAYIWADKDEDWYKHGAIHRIGGPALNRKDCAYWYKFNKRHRLNAPAVIYTNNKNYHNEWWEFGKEIK
jgi:hypothetical protein